jgi:DNA helicase II / ATP-dependent DNA helicase PcrA
MARTLAIIGTAGRDKTQPIDAALWNGMVSDLQARLRPDDALVSGGAALADHLAVHAFLSGWVQKLTLYLPAPFNHGPGQAPVFEGPQGSSASASNFYHGKFMAETGIDGRAQIAEAIARGAVVHTEPAAKGYGGMFSRNAKVAKACDGVIAYTFGETEQPADGGTLDTWRKIAGPNKVHVPLGPLRGATQRAQEGGFVFKNRPSCKP